jgi:hypothetical protein
MEAADSEVQCIGTAAAGPAFAFFARGAGRFAAAGAGFSAGTLAARARVTRAPAAAVASSWKFKHG